MPLTPEEVAFLGPTLAEYSEIRTGPAWRKLRELGVNYQSLIWLMEAQKIVDPPGIDTVVAADGTAAEVFRLGRDADPVPECPWADAHAVARRDAEIRTEVESHREAEKS